MLSISPFPSFRQGGKDPPPPTPDTASPPPPRSETRRPEATVPSQARRLALLRAAVPRRQSATALSSRHRSRAQGKSGGAPGSAPPGGAHARARHRISSGDYWGKRGKGRPPPAGYRWVSRRSHPSRGAFHAWGAAHLPPPRFVAGCVCVCVEKQTEPRSMAFGSRPPRLKSATQPRSPGAAPSAPAHARREAPAAGQPRRPPPARSLLPRRPGPGSPQPAIPYIAAAAAINSPAPPAGAGPGAAGGGFSAAGTRHHPRLGDGHVFLTFDSFLCRGAAARLPVLVGGGGPGPADPRRGNGPVRRRRSRRSRRRRVKVERAAVP